MMQTPFGALVISLIGSGSLSPSATSMLIVTLTSVNEALIGPDHSNKFTFNLHCLRAVQSYLTDQAYLRTT